MPLQPLRIIKNWFTNTRTREQNWDEIANNLTSYSNRTNNNLKQLALDIDGADYDYNNEGKATQTTAIIPRIETLEANQLDIIGTRGLGLDVSTTSIVKLVGSDGSALSSTNFGYATFNSTTNSGRVVTRQVAADISITLTGAHWGFDTEGDLTDQALWILLLDTGSAVTLGVTATPGRNSIAAADTDTAIGNITSPEKVLVSTSLGGTLSCITFAKILADFDDTGNAGGENFWTIQTGVGEIEIGPHPHTIGSEIFF